MNPLALELRKIDGEPSAHWLHIGDMRVLISYETPVAFSRQAVCYRTSRRFSRTTSRCINKLCDGWPVADHDQLMQLISDNLLVIIKYLKGDYDIVHESYRWNDVLTTILDRLSMIGDQSWTDVAGLKEAVSELRVTAIAAMLDLAGPKVDPGVLLPQTERGRLVKLLADRVRRGEPNGCPS